MKIFLCALAFTALFTYTLFLISPCLSHETSDNWGDENEAHGCALPHPDNETEPQPTILLPKP